MNLITMIVFGCLGVVFGMLAVMFLVCCKDWKHKIIGAIVCIIFWLLISGSICFDAFSVNNEATVMVYIN